MKLKDLFKRKAVEETAEELKERKMRLERVQEAELSEAMWVRREDIPEYETDVSISCCLIENFRQGFTIKDA